MNVKRNLFATLLASTLMGVGTGAASAVEQSWLLKQGFYGSQTKSKSDTKVKISGTTKYITVNHEATVKIENDKGQSFVWQFNSAMEMSNFPLRRIAPSGFDSGNTLVSVIHPAHHDAP